MKPFLLHNKFLFSLTLFFKALANGLLVGFALMLEQGINMLYEHTEVSDFLYMILFMLLYAAAYGCILFTEKSLSASYKNKAVSKMRTEFCKKLIGLPYEEFAKSDSSKYISHLTNDMKTISVNYFSALMNIADETFRFVFALAAAFYIHYAAAITMLGLTSLVFIVPLVFNKPLNKANLELSAALKSYTQIIKETFLGIDVIKNFNSEERAAAKIKEYGARLTAKNIRIERLNSFSSSAGALIVTLLQIGSVAVSGYLMLKGFILIGAVVAVVQLSNNMFAPVVNISTDITLLGGVKGLLKAFGEILNNQKSLQTKKLKSFERSITLRGVSFKFPNDSKAVLSDINLCFEKGKKYLISGRSGSGKSTMLKILSKLYRNYEGEILVDDVPLDEIGEKELNRYISFAQQKSYLFNRSIRKNIDFNSTNNQEKLDNVVHLSCLDSFLDRLEKDLDTVVNEEVKRVSGGEKLRVGLARTLYKDTDILLLDEITSALDKETAYTVEKNILSLEGKTVINVSHKVHEDLIDCYDAIGIIEDGTLLMFAAPADARETAEFTKYISSSADDPSFPDEQTDT